MERGYENTDTGNLQQIDWYLFIFLLLQVLLPNSTGREAGDYFESQANLHMPTWLYFGKYKYKDIHSPEFHLGLFS